MHIDFRQGSRLNVELLPLFNSVAAKSREKYNQIIHDSSIPVANEVNWWAENVSSRNTYTCPLFHLICCIELVIELEKAEHEIQSILVDSKELKKILKVNFSNYLADTKILYKPHFSLRLKEILLPFYYEWFLFHRLIRFFYTKIFLIKTRFKQQEYVLIDTFISSSFVNEDRWYGDFWDYLNPNQKEEIFFVPTIVDQDIRSFIKILKSLEDSDRKTIIKEEFLKLTDIFYAYQHKFRKKKLSLGKSFLGKIDTSDLVKECYLKNRDIFSLLEAILTYNFIKNLSETGINIKLSIDWFEGHPVDKLWNLGIYRYFEDAKILAYQTFRSFPYYLSNYPIPIEVESKVVPKNFAVQGQACKRFVKEFCPDLTVRAVPAFKNLYLWDEHEVKLNSSILVAFPISLYASADILNSLIKSNDLLKQDDIEFILKPHPTVESKSILSVLDSKIPDNFSFTTESSFPSLILESSLLITEASSVCLESLALGKPVVVVQSNTGLTYDPIPDDIPQELFRRTYDDHSLCEAIIHFVNLNLAQRELIEKLGKDIKSRYFEPISTSGIDLFLNPSLNDKMSK